MQTVLHTERLHFLFVKVKLLCAQVINPHQ